MTDWATQEAAEILLFLLESGSSAPTPERRAWLADKLRLIHLRGEKQGIARLGKALNAETKRDAAE